jgi:hypothetical protein
MEDINSAGVYKGVMAYQTPLFCGLDLTDLFSSKTRLAEAIVRRHVNSRPWDDVVDLAMRLCKTHPLNLASESNVQEFSHSGVREFVHRTKYRGDKELWLLNPVDGGAAGPDAEIHRHELVIGVVAHSEEEAEEFHDYEVEKISEIIDLQSERISLFERTLPSLLENLFMTCTLSIRGSSTTHAEQISGSGPKA